MAAERREAGSPPATAASRRGRRLLVGGLAAGIVVAGALAAWESWAPGEPGAGSRAEHPRAAPGPTGGARATGPAVRPAAGFPDASTTGVADGATLEPSTGITVREDGAVLENLLVRDGHIDVYANDVTIRNVRIMNSAVSLFWGIHQREGYSGLVVEDSEVIGDRSAQLQYGIINHGGMLTVRRVEIRGTTDGVVTSAGVIVDSYLHGPHHFDGDHTDMVQANGGPPDGLNLEIRHNSIVNTEDQTGAVSLFDNAGPVRDVVVEANFLAGGGYTIYGGGLIADGSTPANIVIRDNVFSRRVFPEGGYWGPSAYFDEAAPGNVWSGNVWEDGTEVVLEEQG